MEWLSCFPNKTIIFGVCICLVLKLIVRSLKSTNSHSWSTGIDRAFTWHLTSSACGDIIMYWFDWAEVNMWWLISYDTRRVCLMIGWREISGCLGGDGYTNGRSVRASSRNGMGENETDWLVGKAHPCVTYDWKSHHMWCRRICMSFV